MTQNQKQNLPSEDVSDCKPVTLYFRRKSARDALILTWAKRRSMSMSDTFKDMLLTQVIREITEFANDIHGEPHTVLKHMTTSQLLTMVNEWDAPVSKKVTKTTSAAKKAEGRIEHDTTDEEKKDVKKDVKPAKRSSHPTGDEQPF